MAIDVLPDIEPDELVAASRARSLSAGSRMARLLMPLASLRLTVALFAMAIFLVFAGTLAQVDKDIWQVMQEYFRTWLAWIDFQVFFPRSFFTHDPPHVPGGVYFPGGFLIGAAMGLNLLAAHALRFTVQARGARLLGGLAVIATGVVLTWMVVEGGSGKDTIEGAASFAWSTMWAAMKWCLVAVWLAGLYALVQLDRRRVVERWTLIVAELALGSLLAYVLARGSEAALGDSSMRILWQLIKGGAAGLVLLAGCWLVFRNRAGIVLLHAGVALVMANELVVYGLHVENEMRIREGETIDYTYNTHVTELAVVDHSDPKTDDVVVVPQAILKAGEPIHDDRLPFDVDVVEYFDNANLAPLKPGNANPATAGLGLEAKATRSAGSKGTDADAAVDMPAAYVKLTDKKTHQTIGTYLVSTMTELMPRGAQSVEVDGKKYDIALRFKRTYKPYSMRLDDVRFDKYLGTQTARNYSSDLHLVDSSRGVDRDVKIWMNNPLRFAGETFYQQRYFFDPTSQRESTVLQVVTNTGWMIPYVACMIVGIGMLAQFSITLGRFLRRRRDDAAAAPRLLPLGPVARYLWLGVLVVLGAWVVKSAIPPRVPSGDLQLEEFSRLPVVSEGRVKPFDTLARNTLRYLSTKQTFVDESARSRRRRRPSSGLSTRSGARRSRTSTRCSVSTMATCWKRST